MPIRDLFFKRQSRMRGDAPDVYKYDDLPADLRTQIVFIINDAFGEGSYNDGLVSAAYGSVVQSICRELGSFCLVEQLRDRGGKLELFQYLLEEQNVELVLSAVEVSFQTIENLVRTDRSYRDYIARRMEPEAAISELNARFREHGVGYQFESSQIVKVSEQFVHNELIRPALTWLRGKPFIGANEEFLEAHEHYRQGRNKECLVSALKAFESTIKAICVAKNWPADPNLSAASLIRKCFENGLFPAFLETQLGALRSLLESGLPPLRNKLAGHGQGVTPVVVPGYLARYALNLAASNALLLCEVAGLSHT